MKIKFQSSSFGISFILCFSGTFTSSKNPIKQNTAEGSAKKDIVETKQDLNSANEFLNAADLSDSLILYPWSLNFRDEVVCMSGKGQDPNPFYFKFSRSLFNTENVCIDGLTIDRVDASATLSYNLYHFRERV